MTSDHSTQIPLTVGFLFFALGLIFYFFPPKKINYLYGYRTKNSMNDIHRWRFAQKLSAKLMIFTGIILLVTHFLLSFFKIDQNISETIGLAELILLSLLIFIKTEHDLRSKFGKMM